MCPQRRRTPAEREAAKTIFAAQVNQIVEGHSKGHRMSDLARQFKLSRVRVWQIIKDHRTETERRDKHRAIAQATVDIDDLPIAGLNLPVRIRNCMKNAGLVTVGDARKLHDGELKRFPNFGRSSFAAWKECLDILQKEFPRIQNKKQAP